MTDIGYFYSGVDVACPAGARPCVPVLISEIQCRLAMRRQALTGDLRVLVS